MGWWAALSLVGPKKKAAPEGAAKFREETPQEGRRLREKTRYRAAAICRRGIGSTRGNSENPFNFLAELLHF